ncbi:MAG: ABC transporter permease [Ruminococcaceae bacterium]|nr:ABC transporter permease [Oscillospiraceae bacterium]
MSEALLNFILNAIPVGITLLLGALGEIIVEKAGHLNLGIPGIMCMGGAGSCVALQMMAGSKLHPVLIVLIATIVCFLVGTLMGLLYSFLTVSLRANQNVTGLVMTTFGVSMTNYVVTYVSWEKCQYALPYFRYPFGGSIWQYCGWMVAFAILLTLLVSFVLKKTRVGLHLRAVGENPGAADAVGIKVTLYKYLATCIGCGISALGGLYYIMVYVGSQEAYKSIEPMGWLAVALVIFALWRPVLALVGGLLFGIFFVANSYLPTLFGWHLGLEMTYLLKMLPYVFTILVLVIISIRNKKENQPPAGLGVPYFREER